MYMTDVIKRVVNNHKLHVELVAGSWIEIVTIDDYIGRKNEVVRMLQRF
jgi:hypothetical protein